MASVNIKGHHMTTESPRIIRLAGVQNLRDIGGYQTTGGGVVRWGKVFRSGHLSDMTDACGMEMLARDVEVVIDFRSEPEKKLHPVHWTSMWSPDYVAHPIGGNAAAWVHAMFEGLSKGGGVEGVREQFIGAFETIPIANADGLAGFFQAVLNAPERGAVLYHCTAGKDRTGIATALLLDILGVDRTTIMDDFLLTNRAVNLAEKSKSLAELISLKTDANVTADMVMPMVGVEDAFLAAMYDVIDRDYGSMDAYVRDGLKLGDAEITALRDRFVARGGD